MRIVTKQGRNRGELGPVIGSKAKKATTFSTATLALEGGARSFCLFFSLSLSSREPTVKDINLSSTAFWWKMKLSWQLEEQVFTDDLEGQNMSIWRHCYTVKCAGKMERKMDVLGLTSLPYLQYLNAIYAKAHLCKSYNRVQPTYRNICHLVKR